MMATELSLAATRHAKKLLCEGSKSEEGFLALSLGSVSHDMITYRTTSITSGGLWYIRIALPILIFIFMAY